MTEVPFTVLYEIGVFGSLIFWLWFANFTNLGKRIPEKVMVLGSVGIMAFGVMVLPYLIDLSGSWVI